MSTPFKPHGLIVTPYLDYLYRQAHIDNYVKGMHDPKEHITIELMENILNKVIYKDRDDVFVNSQQPPGLGDNACDLVVKYPVQGILKPGILNFVEGKRTKKNRPYDLKAVEEQAGDYCEEYIKLEGLPFVYATTACGAHVRAWKHVEGGDQLEPMWDRDDWACWTSYKDLGKDEDGKLIYDTMHHMLAAPPQLMEGQTYELYGAIPQGKGKAKESTSAGSTQPPQTAPQHTEPREVTVQRYLAEGKEAVMFTLDGERKTTWQDTWKQAQIRGGIAWYCERFNVFTYD